MNNKKMDEGNAGLSEPEASRRFRNTTVWETNKSKEKGNQVFIKDRGLHMASEKAERI